jgi:DNA polymerase-3 subunit delta
LPTTNFGCGHPFYVTTCFPKSSFFIPLPDKSDKNSLAAALRVNPFFIEEYRQAARNYPPSKTRSIISLLREYDLKSKGIGNVSAEPSDLMKNFFIKFSIS